MKHRGENQSGYIRHLAARPCTTLEVVLFALALGSTGCPNQRPATNPDPDTAFPDIAADLTAERSGDQPKCLGDRPIITDLHLPDRQDTAPVDLPADVPHADIPVDVTAKDLPVDVTTKDLVADVTAKDTTSPKCPVGMVLVGGALCMDLYEASRPDATKTSEGKSATKAENVKGVLPWQGLNLSTARAACKAAGKRLCKLAEWIVACQGPAKTVYGYGNKYHPTTCNGIDKYCYCSSGTCATVTPCPYAHCIDTCWADFKVDPTGASPDCKSVYGIFDINGNVWELADSTDGKEHFRGGAYNCSNSESLHRCDHDGTWGPTARGFRCCANPK